MSAGETVGAVVLLLVLNGAVVLVAFVAAERRVRYRPRHRGGRRERGSAEGFGAVLAGLVLGAVGAFIVWKGSGQ